MSDPFIGEIMQVSFDFPPRGFAQCNGQLLPINQNQALFSLLGTMYGGNGTTNFALPDLRSRLPMHRGPGYDQGAKVGRESVTLTVAEMPAHRHPFVTSGNASLDIPAGNAVGGISPAPLFAPGGTSVSLAPAANATAGGNQPHDNMMPYQCTNFVIALVGIFPSRN